MPWFVYAMLSAPFALIAIAILAKSIQVRAAGQWPRTPGKIVVARAQQRQIKVPDSSREDGHRFETRNFANVVYEYAVRGQLMRNDRVSIGEDRGNFRIAETIARYPVGSAVTVYYNPRHPRETVLERDLPEGMTQAMTIGGVILTIAMVVITGVQGVTDFVSARLVQPQLSVPVVALSATGLVVALFACAMKRQASQVASWPVVAGVIVHAGLEMFRTQPYADGRRGPRMMTNALRYRYSYEGLDYVGIHHSLGRTVTSNIGWLVRRSQPDYVEGEAVKVCVNPDHPAIAALDASASGLWLLWSAVVLLWSVAIYLATSA